MHIPTRGTIFGGENIILGSITVVASFPDDTKAWE